MTSAEAAKLLDLPADATVGQLEARFLGLRAKIEDRIAKAPTPGLKAKYRESLDAITLAFETLTLAADSSNLPVIHQRSASGTGPAGNLTPQTSHLTPPAARKGSGKEFLIVTLLAVTLLGVGGWFVMKTRAENAEQARVAAEAKAEAERVAAAAKADAERKAEEARLAAEAKHKADEEERARLAAAEKAEQTRKNALTAQLRTELAEARIVWESLVKEERNAERALNEYRSEARAIQREGPATKYNELVGRAAATQRYLAWLGPHLERHPAQIARAKIEELLSAHLPDEAQGMMEELRTGLATLQQEVTAQKTLLNRLEGSLQVLSSPAGLEFELIDGFGHRHTGRTPAQLATLCPGPAVITAKRSGFQNVSVTTPVETGVASHALVEVVSETITLTAEPDVEFWSNNVFLSRGQFTFFDYAPNSYVIELRRQGFRSFHTKVEVRQGKSARTENYNFTAMSAQKHNCHECNGTGRLEDYRACSSCGGERGQRCRICGGDGIFAVVSGQAIRCSSCGGDGFIKCRSCNGEGETQVRSTCRKCGGDGRLSDIDLAAP